MIAKICRAAVRMSTEQSGNVALLFAFAIVPVFFVLGIAIDYGRAAAARTAMQAAADAAALMAAKDASKSSAADLKLKAEKYFKALLDRSDITGISVNAVYSTASGGGQTLTLDASGMIPNQFMSMAFLGGSANSSLATSAVVRWGARYRVALALDNTGSMSSASKMDELKKAARKMINDFADMAKSADDIFISIVPFSLDVNVGTDKKNQSWLSWDYIGSCINTTNNRKDATKTNGPDCRATPNRRWETTTAEKNAWKGCVSDRDFARIGDHDTKNTVPNPAMKETLFDADSYDTGCPQPMLGMTSVYTKKQDLLNKIDAMTPSGNTNQTIGLQWAWMTHTIGQGPFPAPAKDETMEYKDVIILLTDGENTQNRWDNCQTMWWIWNCVATRLDNRQAMLCNNIKASNSKMDIYTVQVATDGDPVQPVTKNCASKPDDPTYFSYITNASQLSTKFKNIFESIARLRVSA